MQSMGQPHLNGAGAGAGPHFESHIYPPHPPPHTHAHAHPHSHPHSHSSHSHPHSHSLNHSQVGGNGGGGGGHGYIPRGGGGGGGGGGYPRGGGNGHAYHHGGMNKGDLHAVHGNPLPGMASHDAASSVGITGGGGGYNGLAHPRNRADSFGPDDHRNNRTKGTSAGNLTSSPPPYDPAANFVPGSGKSMMYSPPPSHMQQESSPYYQHPSKMKVDRMSSSLSPNNVGMQPPYNNNVLEAATVNDSKSDFNTPDSPPRYVDGSLELSAGAKPFVPKFSPLGQIGLGGIVGGGGGGTVTSSAGIGSLARGDTTTISPLSGQPSILAGVSGNTSPLGSSSNLASLATGTAGGGGLPDLSTTLSAGKSPWGTSLGSGAGVSLPAFSLEISSSLSGGDSSASLGPLLSSLTMPSPIAPTSMLGVPSVGAAGSGSGSSSLCLGSPFGGASGVSSTTSLLSGLSVADRLSDQEGVVFGLDDPSITSYLNFGGLSVNTDLDNALGSTGPLSSSRLAGIVGVIDSPSSPTDRSKDRLF